MVVDEAEGSVLVSAGDDFETFVRTHYRSVLALAYALTGNRETAEDLTQDAFSAAHGRWPRIGGFDDPGAWVRRAVANRAVSVRRRRISEARAVLRLGARPAETPVLTEQDEALWKAVRRLSRRQSQVVALVYGEDLSLAEAAIVLGCSEETAKTHLRRAKIALAKRIGRTAEEKS